MMEHGGGLVGVGPGELACVPDDITHIKHPKLEYGGIGEVAQCCSSLATLV